MTSTTVKGKRFFVGGSVIDPEEVEEGDNEEEGEEGVEGLPGEGCLVRLGEEEEVVGVEVTGLRVGGATRIVFVGDNVGGVVGERVCEGVIVGILDGLAVEEGLRVGAIVGLFVMTIVGA